MKPYIATLLNAFVLILGGLWGYMALSGNGGEVSMTAFIPIIAGGVLLLFVPGMRKENKVIAHIVVLLTFLLIPGFIKPLTGAIDRGDNMGILRVVLYMVFCVIAMVSYIKSFIDARKARESA